MLKWFKRNVSFLFSLGKAKNCIECLRETSGSRPTPKTNAVVVFAFWNKEMEQRKLAAVFLPEFTGGREKYKLPTDIFVAVYERPRTKLHSQVSARANNFLCSYLSNP